MCLLLLIAFPNALLLPPIFLLPQFRKRQSIFDSTAALQHVWVVAGIVSFADHICASELEFWRQVGFACPFDVLFAVAGAGVRAAHYVDRVKVARAAADTLELWNGGDAAVGREGIFAESEGFDGGELDAVGACGGSGEGEGGDNGDEEVCGVHRGYRILVTRIMAESQSLY